MERIERDFEKREPSERQWMIDNTWCEHCSEADLGMIDPIEFEEDGQIFVEGHCRKCGTRIVNLVNEIDS